MLISIMSLSFKFSIVEYTFIASSYSSSLSINSFVFSFFVSFDELNNILPNKGINDGFDMSLIFIILVVNPLVSLLLSLLVSFSLSFILFFFNLIAPSKLYIFLYALFIRLSICCSCLFNFSFNCLISRLILFICLILLSIYEFAILTSLLSILYNIFNCNKSFLICSIS